MSFALVATNVLYIIYDVDAALEYASSGSGANNNGDGGGDTASSSSSSGGGGGFNANDELVSFYVMGNDYSLSKGMAILWTFGSLLHSLFDFTLWQVSACACCHPGGRCYQESGFCSMYCNDLGSYMLVPFVLAMVGLAGYSSFRRVTAFNELEDEFAVNDDLYQQVTGGTLGPYTFLVKYVTELFLAWFVYFPLVTLVFFSGVLGCGKLPVLGGRPRDKARVEQELAERNQLARDGVYSSF